jgi:hypothetical protein
MRDGMQLSLQSLFVLLGFCALFCVAVLSAATAWVIVLRGIALVSLLFALLAIWYRRAQKRAFWVGYLHGGAAYGLLTFYALGGMSEKPVWNDEQILSGQLATVTYKWLPESKRATPSKQHRARSGRLPAQPLVPSSAPPNVRYLFHSAFIVFSGWIGGLVGVWFYKTRDEAHAAAPQQPG